MAKKKSKATNQSQKAKTVDFEKALAEAELVVEKLESGELGLADSLEQYELGIKRIKQCHQSLKDAQRRVSLLSGVTEDGEPITESFSDDSDLSETSLDQQSDDSEWEEEDWSEEDEEEESGDESSVDEPPGLF